MTLGDEHVRIPSLPGLAPPASPMGLDTNKTVSSSPKVNLTVAPSFNFTPSDVLLPAVPSVAIGVSDANDGDQAEEVTQPLQNPKLAKVDVGGDAFGKSFLPTL